MKKTADINIRDPFIFTEGGYYYMCGTTDKNAWGGPAEGFDVYKGTDLKNWEGPFRVFTRDESFWADENFWAPELHKYGSKYYIFATFFNRAKSRRSQILIGDSPAGAFKPLSEPVTPADWYSLDMTLHVQDGTPYAVFCHEWMQITDGEICAVKLSADLKKTIGKPATLFRASEAPWVKPFEAEGRKNNLVTDGPFLYRLKSGKLLMLWSSIGAEGYAMGMAVSPGGLFDKWTHIDKPLFSKDGGHGMVFKGLDGNTYVSLHRPNTPSGAERAEFFKVTELDDRLTIDAAAE